MRMFCTCGCISRGYRNSKLSNGCPQKKGLASGTWKIVLGLNDCDGKNHQEKNLKAQGRLDKGDLSGLGPAIKNIMKQISNFKKKLAQGKKSSETGSLKHQQNGQQHKKKTKKPIDKKIGGTEDSEAKNKLNVNERPIRKKKKTKKYECYERNGKSPEPELAEETNLLLALGLTPVKKASERDEGKTKKKQVSKMLWNGQLNLGAAEMAQSKAGLPKMLASFAGVNDSFLK